MNKNVYNSIFLKLKQIGILNEKGVMLVGVYFILHHSGSFDIMLGRILMILGSCGLFSVLKFIDKHLTGS